MIGLLTRFVQRRRRPLTVLLTAVGSTYLALSYIKSKLAEMHDSLSRSQHTTENLRRRFHQNQDDCLFTVTALVPTLGKQIVESLDVERLAEVLNQTKKSRPIGSSHEPTTPPVLLGPGPASNPPIDTGEPQPEHGLVPTVVVPEELGAKLNHSPTSQDLTASTAQLDPLHAHTNAPDPPPPAPESVSEVLLRPDGTALRKRSEIWKEVMVLSFTRLFTCIYAIALLTMQTHIQLGLLGRNAYLNSVLGPEELDPELQDSETLQMDHDTEQRYLTFSWWYLHHGWRILSDRVRSAVEEVLSRKSLKEDICLNDLSLIFSDIRRKVEQSGDGRAFSFLSILLPSTRLDELETLKSGGMTPSNCVINPNLRSLLNETQDFIDCNDFHTVLQKSLDRVIPKSLENIARKLKLFNPQISSSNHQQQQHLISHPRFVELKDGDDDGQQVLGIRKTARFVSILPVITRESHHILDSLPNEYTELLSSTNELKEFSSVIYTSFDISSV